MPRVVKACAPFVDDIRPRSGAVVPFVVFVVPSLGDTRLDGVLPGSPQGLGMVVWMLVAAWAVPVGAVVGLWVGLVGWLGHAFVVRSVHRHTGSRQSRSGARTRVDGTP